MWQCVCFFERLCWVFSRVAWSWPTLTHSHVACKYVWNLILRVKVVMFAILALWKAIWNVLVTDLIPGNWTSHGCIWVLEDFNTTILYLCFCDVELCLSNTFGRINVLIQKVLGMINTLCVSFCHPTSSMLTDGRAVLKLFHPSQTVHKVLFIYHWLIYLTHRGWCSMVFCLKQKTEGCNWQTYSFNGSTVSWNTEWFFFNAQFCWQIAWQNRAPLSPRHKATQTNFREHFAGREHTYCGATVFAIRCEEVGKRWNVVKCFFFVRRIVVTMDHCRVGCALPQRSRLGL